MNQEAFEVRFRPRRPRRGQAKSWTVINGGVYSVVSGTSVQTGRQKTVSKGNPVSLLGKTDLNIGGDFWTSEKWMVKGNIPLNSHSNSSNPRFFHSGDAWVVNIPIAKDWYTGESSSEELMAFGTTAISRCSPVRSESETLTALIEIVKEKLPSLPGSRAWKERASPAKAAGDEYLNIQFGWIPLISEIRDIAKAHSDTDRIYNQLIRDNGRNVRRRYVFPSVRKHEIISDVTSGTSGLLTSCGANISSYLYNPIGNTAGRLIHERETIQDRWFSGCFTYHVPTSQSALGQLGQGALKYEKLFGVIPSPEVLWNIAPWSWAVDWFTNSGDLISNLSNALLYNQVLRYGYMMEKTTIIDTYTRYCDNLIQSAGPYTAVYKTVTKKRVGATPYGFGLTFDGFDNYQLSIIAALGLSKLK